MATRIIQSTAVVAVGSAVAVDSPTTTFQAVATGSGTVTGTILIQVSNDGTNWITAGTITLNATSPAIDGLAVNAKWAYVRSNVTAISAATTAVVTMGI